MHDDTAAAVLRRLRAPGRTPQRLLLTGWFSFRDGEATAGDVLAQTARPGAYDVLLFVCGPVHGPQVAALHDRFRTCRRLAAGVSVVDPADPAVAGFHEILARDGTSAPARPDLAAGAPVGPPPPVAGVVLSSGQGEYGGPRRHEDVNARITGWLAGKDCARVAADTRLAADDWRLCGTAEQFLALVSRFDVVVTTRLHGLVLALRTGTPVIAVDPVAGGAKVGAQARTLGWPALVEAGALDEEVLDHWWGWALSECGRTAAARHSMR
ncbi:polysaccharide pyruvyl transferase family protein [Streptomyces sp. NPDC001606]